MSSSQGNSLDSSIPGGESDLDFQRLLLRNHDPLLRWLSGRIPADLRSTVGAEDLLQETFVSAIQSRHSFEYQGDESFFAWLNLIAERRLTDAVRRLHTEKRGGDRAQVREAAGPAMTTIMDLLELAAVYSRTPSQSAADHEAVQAVHEALAQLSDVHREALRLRYLEGRSMGEIAAAMGRSEDAVMKLCQRGLDELQSVVGDPARFFSSRTREP